MININKIKLYNILSNYYNFEIKHEYILNSKLKKNDTCIKNKLKTKNKKLKTKN